jgi:hypothetical protein
MVASSGRGHRAVPRILARRDANAVPYALLGQRGAAIDVLRPGGSPFPTDHPRLVRCCDFKDAIKAEPLSSTESAGVTIPNAKNA